MRRMLYAGVFVLVVTAPRAARGQALDELIRQIREIEDRKERTEVLEPPKEAADATGKYVHLMRGRAHNAAARYEEAVAEFKAALELDDDFQRARSSLAWTYYYNMGELELAAENFSRIIRDEDADDYLRASSYNGLAEIFRTIREMDTSIALHEKGVSLRPTCVGWHNLAWLYNTHRGDFKKAIELCERSLENNPHYEYGRISLAVFLANDSQTERAREIIEGVDTSKPVRQYNLACYYAVTGDKENAIRCVARYLREYCTFARRRDQTREYMLQDWHLDALKCDPRFIELMRMEGQAPPLEGEPPAPEPPPDVAF